MNVGDLVTRKSHGHDIIFRITSMHPDGNVRLKGHHWRLEADAPISDLTLASVCGSTETWLQTREKMATAKENLFINLDRSRHQRNIGNT